MRAACSAIGDSLPGFQDICRSQFHGADAALASSSELHSIWCFLRENGWVTHPSDFLRTHAAGEGLISLTCLLLRFLSRFTGSFETLCVSSCSGPLSHSSAQAFSPATRRSPATFFRDNSPP